MIGHRIALATASLMPALVVVALAVVARRRSGLAIAGFGRVLSAAVPLPGHSGRPDPSARRDDAPAAGRLPVQGDHGAVGGHPGLHRPDGGKGGGMAAPPGWPDYAGALRGPWS